MITELFGLIPRKVRLEFDASIDSVVSSLSHPHSGMRVELDGRRFKIVHDPGLQQPVSVFEGSLIDDGERCILEGAIRWGRTHQVFLLTGLTFLVAFCFGVPALMIRSIMMGTAKFSLGHPLVVPILWATVTWLPFHFLLGIIFRSRLPQIERQLGDIILERPKNENG